LFKC